MTTGQAKDRPGDGLSGVAVSGGLDLKKPGIAVGGGPRCRGKATPSLAAQRKSGSLAAMLVLAVLSLPVLAGPALAADVEALEKAVTPGNQALSRVLPELDALAGPVSRDVLDGKADIHVFYGMAVARILYQHCQDTISLIRASKAQECPALEAALTRQLGDSAERLEGAAQLIAGSLPMVSSARMGILGKATVEAITIYVKPIKEFTASAAGRDL